jgi:ERCC4-type nuclease
MRGHLTKRGKGSWTVVVSLGRDPATGRRRQQWESVKGTKRDAERRLPELLHQLDRGVPIDTSKLQLGDYLTT